MTSPEAAPRTRPEARRSLDLTCSTCYATVAYGSWEGHVAWHQGIEAEAAAGTALDVERLAFAWEEVANAHNGSGPNGEPCGWCWDRAKQTVEVMARLAGVEGDTQPVADAGEDEA